MRRHVKVDQVAVGAKEQAAGKAGSREKELLEIVGRREITQAISS